MDKNKRISNLRRLYAQIPCLYGEEDVEQTEWMMEMSDGIRLRTQFWMPKQEKEISVVVTRNCYPNLEEEFAVHGEEFARRGFGFAVQWCRGVNGSEGNWEPNTYERQDGLDTMNILAAKENIKNIGYWGNSYLASTGWCMADAVPKKVKSMYLGVYGTDRYTSVYQDGLFRQDIFTWWAMDNAGVPVKADYLESCRFRPHIQVDEKLWGVRLDWYREWIQNTDRDSDYWSRKGFWRMMSEIPEKMKIPVFIRDGWYDHHLGSAMVSWKKLSEESKKGSTLQIGPWRHEYDHVLEGQATDNLKDDSVSSPLKWFEKTLKAGQIPEQKTELYVIGADCWVTVNDISDVQEETKILYLDADKGEKESRRLTDTPGDAGKITYQYDPNDPVPSHGTESCFKSVKEIGSMFQPECGYRKDVISFVSEPLEDPMYIMGSIKTELYVSSDAEDTAFTAKIMEIFPDGRCVNIRGNITTLAYRNGSVKRREYEPGKIVPVCIKMWPVAWKMRKGSRIRVDISSSEFPQYSVHTNYPGVWSEQKNTKCALQTVYTGEGRASCLRIPVMDADLVREIENKKTK